MLDFEPQGITFKDDKTKDRWRVNKVYSTKCQYAEIDKRWGLTLPKSQRTER